MYKNIFILGLLVILFFIAFNKCGTSAAPKDSIVETIKWRTKDSLIYRDSIFPKEVIYLPGSILDSPYIPEGSKQYDSLLIQYNSLKNKYFTLNKQFQITNKEFSAKAIYSDTANFDSSYIVINDTVQFNRLDSRSFDFRIKYPVITKEITKYQPPKAHLLIGASVIGSPTDILKGIGVGATLQNKKGNNLDLNFYQMEGDSYYGIGYKVKLW